jgi:dTDP-glucose 4,6-dehydratase
VALSRLTNDLDDILIQTRDLWAPLRGSTVFITGGTGFFGTWLIESLVHANRKLELGVKATVLTRNEAPFLENNPHLKNAAELVFHRGDVRTFNFPTGSFSYVIHAATEAREKINQENPEHMNDVIVQGTRRVLDFARVCGAKRFLLTSSGAVYGPQGPSVEHVGEDDPGLQRPLSGASAYALGKRDAERMCMDAAHEGLGVTIARGFAFVGPHLPLDAHFAIGNFIQDALREDPIKIQGDGMAVRSYLYASDLAIWLWTILLKGVPGRAYNVGSEHRINMSDLAMLITDQIFPQGEIIVQQEPQAGRPVNQYVPSTARARNELGLKETVSLESAIRRTAKWASGR